MNPREVEKIVRDALREQDPRKAFQILRRAERAAGERMAEVREQIGREAARRARLGWVDH